MKLIKSDLTQMGLISTFEAFLNEIGGSTVLIQHLMSSVIYQIIVKLTIRFILEDGQSSIFAVN